MTKLDPEIGSLIGKKGYPKPPKKESLRPKYALDPRWEKISKRSHEMSDEEIYQAMKESGLIDDYPLLQKDHVPTADDFAHGGKRPGSGRKPHPDPKVSKHRIMLRGAMWGQLEAEADERGITVNQMVEYCVSQILGDEPDSG